MNSSNNLSLIHPDEINSILPIIVPPSNNNVSSPKCSLPSLLPRNFVDYDKYYNKYCNKESNEFENNDFADYNLPIISIKQEDKPLPKITTLKEKNNSSKLFYKRTELRPIEKPTPAPKVGETRTYGKMTFVYAGGF